MHQVRIYNKPDLRMTVEGMLYRIRTGCPWRDLPTHFGEWNTVYTGFNDRCAKGKRKQTFHKLTDDPDMEWVFIDGTYVKSHQHSTGAATESLEAIGKSRAGNTTKIHMAVDAFGLPVTFEVTGGEVNACTTGPTLIEKLPEAEAIIADKGYDTETVRSSVASNGSKAVIPRKKNSKIGNSEMDWGLYKYRHLVENIFARLKHFRGIATRYDKLKRNYEGAVAMVCGFLWLPL